MRVMMISDFTDTGGDGGGTDAWRRSACVEHLARALGAQGTAVDIFTRQEGCGRASIEHVADNVRRFLIAAGPVTPVRPRELFPYIPEFARNCMAWARLERYDLVHAHFFLSGLVALHLKERLGLPFVMTFHSLARSTRPRGESRERDELAETRSVIEERLVRCADGVIAESSQRSEDIRKWYGTEAAVVPVGVDLQLFHPEPRAESRRQLGLPLDRKLLLYAGAIDACAGLDNVLRAIATLSRYSEFGDLALMILGGPEEAEARRKCDELSRLANIAADLEVSDRVVFVPRRKQESMRHYYSAADVFVSTPAYEASGEGFLEAMACGTSVIGSNVGGIKDLIERGITGLLVPPRNPDALASAVRFLLTEEDIRNRFSRTGVRRIEESFTWEYAAARALELYEAFVRKREVDRSGLPPGLQRPQGRILAFPSERVLERKATSRSASSIFQESVKNDL